MTRTVVHAFVVALSIPLAFGVSVADAQSIPLKQGVSCDEHAPIAAPAPDEGATHTCYFEPVKAGSRDFGSRNGRAEYIFTVLGAECEEIEILSDEDFSAADGRAVGLKRVRVLCGK